MIILGLLGNKHWANINILSKLKNFVNKKKYEEIA